MSVPSQRLAEYYQKNKEMYIEQAKLYQNENLEKVKEYKANHYQANKKPINEKAKEYRTNNKESIAARGKEYRNQHVEKLKEQNRLYLIKTKYRIKPVKIKEVVQCISCGTSILNYGHDNTYYCL